MNRLDRQRIARRILVLVPIGLAILAASGRLIGGESQPPPDPKVAASAEKTATFAGGCFWCMEPPFEKLAGVQAVVSGYTGGERPNPTYEEVSSGTTGHAEAIEVHYDPSQISYAQLLEVFWRQIDPTDPDGQFVDRGRQYRSSVFYADDEQKRLAEISKVALGKSGRFDKPIVTEIVPAGAFYPAEEYHQDYYKKNPIRYRYYRWGSGRDRFLSQVWGDEEKATEKADDSNESSATSSYRKPSDEELQARLSPLQYRVTQEEATEPPFRNDYWNNKQAGIYVDVVSGEPLFSSADKFDSGTGWPSFTRPLEAGNIVEREDNGLFATRTEVRSKQGDSHLGHVFPDGPAPTGLRYCINSAALRFVPASDLAKEGYDRYRLLFEAQ